MEKQVKKEVSEERILISEFVSEYNKLKSDTIKEAFFKKIKVKQYVPIEIKALTSKAVIGKYVKVEDGIPQRDSVARFIAGIMTMLALYTNLEMSKGNGMTEYDLLKESGLLEKVMALVDEDELNEYNFVFSAVYDDYFKNKLSTHNFVALQVNRFGALCDAGLGKLAESISGYDASKLSKITNTVAEKVSTVMSQVKK